MPNNATMSISPSASLIPVEENRGSHEMQDLYFSIFRNVMVLVVIIPGIAVAALAILGGSGSSSNNSSGINSSG